MTGAKARGSKAAVNDLKQAPARKEKIRAHAHKPGVGTGKPKKWRRSKGKGNQSSKLRGTKKQKKAAEVREGSPCTKCKPGERWKFDDAVGELRTSTILPNMLALC